MYVAGRIRQASLVTRRVRTISVVAWFGGAASILPFATGWFDLGARAPNVLLFTVLVSAFAFSLLINASASLQRGLTRLAGPPEQPAHALVLVAVVAAAGVAAMLAAAALVGSS